MEGGGGNGAGGAVDVGLADDAQAGGGGVQRQLRSMMWSCFIV